MGNLQKGFFIAVVTTTASIFIFTSVTKLRSSEEDQPTLVPRMQQIQPTMTEGLGGNSDSSIPTKYKALNKRHIGIEQLNRTLPIRSSSASEEDWLKEQTYRKWILKLGCHMVSNSMFTGVKSWTLEELSKNVRLNNVLVDDVHKMLYCYIPKVACTQWKRLLMVLTGSTKYKDPQLIPTVKAHFASGVKTLTPSNFQSEDILRKLATYKKVMIVRHPLERLLSAYNDKFAQNSSDANNFKKYYAPQMMRFARHTQNIPLTGDGMTFEEFLSFLSSHPSQNFQEHWSPYFHLCHPCSIEYDFIGKYETLEKDSNNILRAVRAPSKVSFPSFHPTDTARKLASILDSISSEIRQRLYRTYFLDYLLFDYKEPPS